MEKVIYPELSYKITGLLFEVHNELGRFRREKYYGDLLEIKLKEVGMKYEREKTLPSNERRILERVDFLVDDKILAELKAKKFITKEDYFQMMNYLKAMNLKLGLIANFRNTYLKPKRIVNLYQ